MNDKNKFSEIDNDLRRFLQAQQNVYPQVLKELRNGKKTSFCLSGVFALISLNKKNLTVKPR